MSNHTVIWSAATCDGTGGGVYVGIAPQYEHMIVARALSKRQAKLFIGGRVLAPGEGGFWQVYYYAVRDPSAVRIVPVDRGRAPGGFRPAELRFRFAPSVDESIASPYPAALASWQNGEGPIDPAVFILTVGMQPGADRAFFQRAIGHDRREWSEVFTRIRDEACDEAA